MEIVKSNEKSLSSVAYFTGKSLISSRVKRGNPIDSFLSTFSDTTKTTYETCLILFFTRWSFLHVSRIEPRHVREYIFTDLEGRSRNYQSLTKSALSSFFDFLIVEGVLKNNPARPVKLLKVDKKKFINNVPTEEEVYRIIDCFKSESLKVLTEMLFITGLRISEALALRFSSFKEEQNYYKAILVGKGHKTRNVKISKEFCEKLSLIKRESNDGPLFPNKTDLSKSITQRGYLKSFKISLEKSKIQKKISPHKLRHACAVELLNAGVDLMSVKKHLGHESIRSTSVYTTFCKSEDVALLLERKIKKTL